MPIAPPTKTRAARAMPSERLIYAFEKTRVTTGELYPGSAWRRSSRLALPGGRCSFGADEAPPILELDGGRGRRRRSPDGIRRRPAETGPTRARLPPQLRLGGGVVVVPDR